MVSALWGFRIGEGPDCGLVISHAQSDVSGAGNGEDPDCGLVINHAQSDVFNKSRCSAETLGMRSTAAFLRVCSGIRLFRVLKPLTARVLLGFGGLSLVYAL